MALLFGAAKWYNYGVMRTIAIFVCLLAGIVAAEPCFNVERDIYRMVGNDGANEWASDGLIENNRMRGLEMCAIDVTSEPVPFMEGGCSRNVTIVDNDIEGCGGGIVVSGVTPSGRPLPVGAHRDIRICRNRVSAPGPALKAVGCEGLVLEDNKFDSDKGKTIELINCK